ncbi:N-acyl amino acid synthase FeeM domain-containing protein [Tenacibaculum sp. 190524A02b]|uniref:N-acyl amino acid synthase FeeM domain-containing protein n=1 Tax=Tenacibaculum vairaonense TaxID=3137860 RepID=UPI0031FB095B
MYLQNNFQEISTKRELFKLIQFIVKENYTHHAVNENTSSLFEECYELYKEEALFFENSIYYVVKSLRGSIVAGIRICKYKEVSLPIEKVFGIDIKKFVTPKQPIFHIGRFAIHKNCKSLVLLKQLLVLALAPLTKNKQSVAFAECDAKLYKILRMLGIKVSAIGKPLVYLGSTTIPIIIQFKDFIRFYKAHKYLINNQEVANFKQVI